MAPPMPAEVLGRPTPILVELVEAIEWPAPLALALLETAGGLRSPIAADDDSLKRAIDPDDVLLVADARLGEISDCILVA